MYDIKIRLTTYPNAYKPNLSYINWGISALHFNSSTNLTLCTYPSRFKVITITPDFLFNNWKHFHTRVLYTRARKNNVQSHKNERPSSGGHLTQLIRNGE